MLYGVYKREYAHSMEYVVRTLCVKGAITDLSEDNNDFYYFTRFVSYARVGILHKTKEKRQGLV